MIDSVKPSSESSSTHVVVEAPSTANERSVLQFNQALSGENGQSNTGGDSHDENADADNKTPVTAAAPAMAAPVNVTPRSAIPPDLNTPEGFSRWRDERLQLTGKSALDDKDFQALAARSVDNLTQKMSREDYSMTGADHAALTVRTAHDNALDSGFITPAYNGKQFLEQLPDAYYHALVPATGEQLKVGDMQALITEYAQLQPQHQDPAAKARLDAINQQLEPYREAYSYREPYFDSTSDSPAWITAQRQNYRFEGSRADFRAAVGKDMTITQQQTHRVSGGELLNAIAENTRYGHVAGADNNKNGAFDPTKDRRGLSGFVSGFIENVIENPVIRAVAQVAQFTPLAPVATAFNTVAAIHDTVQAVEDGNISKVLSSAAGVAVGAGKITGSATITNTAGSLRDASTLASIIEDPKKAALDYASGKVATYVGHGDNGKSPFGDAKPLAHGITQGAIQELRGGEFRSGFAGAMATPLANSLSETLGMTGRSSLATQQRMMLAGVAGGIAAELVGGDFQEGMESARFVTFFNDEASQRLAELALENHRQESTDNAENWIFPGEHNYQMQNVVCEKNDYCTAENVRQFLLQEAAFPNQTQPVLDSGVAQQFNVGSLAPFGLSGDDHIYSVPTSGGVTNITDTDHLLYPGWIIREVISDDKNISIQTTGGGSGWFGALNNQQKYNVWNAVDQKITSHFIQSGE